MFLILFDTFHILKTDVFIHECAFLNLTIYRRPLPAAWIKVEMHISLF